MPIETNNLEKAPMMKNSTRVGRVMAVLTVLMLLVAACGGGSTDGDSALLPTNDNPDETPAASGTCLEGEPDCNDTPGDGVPLDLPSGDDEGEPISPSGMLVEGGLSVSDALTTDATGIIAVQGFLLDDGTGARLCEALAESYPPQCGGASIPVSGYEEVIDVPLANAQSVTWTDETVSLFGEIVDGTLVVDPTVAG